MEKVFISASGTVSFTKDANTVATAKMHCEQPEEYKRAAEQASYIAYSAGDIELMDINWMYKCKQSLYRGTLHYCFQDFQMIQQPA